MPRYSCTPVAVPPEERKESGKRDDILPVMLHDRDKRAGVFGSAVGLVELRHHPARDIVRPGDAENPCFKCAEPA